MAEERNTKKAEEAREESDDMLLCIPQASSMVERIKQEVLMGGAAFRKAHPELVNKLATLLSGIHRGKEIYIENKHHEYNMDDVTMCLDGLGYEVKPAHPEWRNPYGAFRIVWWPDGEPNPYLG